MSTFGGKLKEIPEISIDRFDGCNLESQAFFLSHCHTDHMAGLDDPIFHQKLIDDKRYLYLSHVSAEILKRMHPAIADHLVELDQYSSTTVELEDRCISVMPISAGHCPGSVMFLFNSNKTILYTGDYRINPADLPKLKAFYDSMNSLRRIDAVYLDTTFFLKDYFRFPPRSESLEEICSIIKNWISRSDKHAVQLDTSAKYGYEYLFIEIFKQFKIPIHVNDDIYEFYSRVPELDKAVTKSEINTKIHVGCRRTCPVMGYNILRYTIKTIKISAFRWKNDNLQKGISNNNYNTHFVCYSTHASYEEGVALLKFLKPKKVEPNVLHKKFAIDREIYNNIEESIAEFKDAPSPKKVKLFEVDEFENVSPKQTAESIDFNSSIYDSPPTKCCNRSMELKSKAKVLNYASTSNEESLEKQKPDETENDDFSNSILDSPPRKYGP